jgi:glycosyltransferase involved in cell wall biosynthesis
MYPLVSILIPAFNAQEWIADTLRSAIAQTYQRKEIVVIDDGSTDATLRIARQFESDNLRVMSQENQGAAAARNKALSEAQGDWIQWLDADDLLAPDKVARQVEAFQHCRSNRTLLSSSWGKFMYRYRHAEFLPTALWCDLSPSEWLIRKLDQGLFMQTATWLVSRQVTEAAGPWDRKLSVDDDGEYFCRVLLVSDGVHFVPEAKVYYRASGAGSLSYIGASAQKMNSQWRSMQLHIRYLRSLEESGRVRTACLKYLQRSLMYFYPERLDIVRQAEALAAELGGQLERPRFSWKYSWIKAAFGWRMTKLAWRGMPRLRWSLKRAWDRALFHLDRKPENHLIPKHVALGTKHSN